MTDDQTSITLVEEKTIEFLGIELTAMKLESGEILVSIAELCERLDLSLPIQLDRIYENEVLREALLPIRVSRTLKTDGPHVWNVQDMFGLPLNLLPGWLFDIQTAQVNETISPELLRYPHEASEVLWDAFKGDMLPAVESTVAVPIRNQTPAERVLALAEEIQEMAKRQLALERSLIRYNQRLNLVEAMLDAAHAPLNQVDETVHARDLAPRPGECQNRHGDVDLAN